MKIALFLCAFVFLGSLSAFADTGVCEIKTPQDILECAVRNHPDLGVSQAALDRDLLLPKTARQRPNPELESKIVGGSDSGSGVIETESSLLATLEIGGKRKARIRQAKATGEVTEAGHRKTLEEVVLSTVLSLRRLAQIQSELGYVRESLTTFGSILDQFRTRPTLAPELSVSQAVFEMAREEYRLKERVLIEEENQLKTALEFATGIAYPEIKRHLPQAKRSWPKVPPKDDPMESDVASNSDLKRALAERKLAEANLNLARSQSWPDLKIGPTIETRRLGGGNDTLFGGSIALPLPLLNLNRGGRQFAAADKARADLNLRVTSQKVSRERELQRVRYETAVKALARSKSQGEMAGKHRDIETFFGRGLVPSSLVIESHRQMVEVNRALHEQELTALDALWRIRILDGTFLEDKI